VPGNEKTKIPGFRDDNVKGGGGVGYAGRGKGGKNNERSRQFTKKAKALPRTVGETVEGVSAKKIGGKRE